MYDDVRSLRREFARHYGTPQRAETRRKLSAPVRGWLKKLIRKREGTRAAIGRAFPFAQLGAGRREVAVAATAALATLQLGGAVLGIPNLGGTADEYFGYIRNLQHASPKNAPWLVPALVLTARAGTDRLRTLVANEAAARLGLTAPDAKLLRVVGRYLDRFRAIASEALRLAVTHGQSIPAAIETTTRARACLNGRELAGVVGATSA